MRSRLPSVYFWMIAPAVVVALGLIVFPLGRTVWLSFTNQGVTGAGTWVGFANYTRLLGDSGFWNSVGVSLVFITSTVFLELVIAWCLALLLERTVRGLTPTLRMLFTVPMMLSPVIVGVAWRALFNPHFGWVNAILGTPGQDWLGNPDRALPVLIALNVWQWTPFLFLMISAGLLSVPGEVKEAARIDGAGGFRLFRSIVFPLTLPVTLVAILLRALDATKSFDLPFTLTGGGPGTTTQTVAIFLYRRAFSDWQQGYASAVAVGLTVGLTLIAIIYLRITRAVERRFL